MSPRRIPGSKVFLDWQGVYLPLSSSIFPLPLFDTSNLNLTQPEIQKCVLWQRKNSQKSTLAVAQGSDKETPYPQREYRNLPPFYLSVSIVLSHPSFPRYPMLVVAMETCKSHISERREFSSRHSEIVIPGRWDQCPFCFFPLFCLSPIIWPCMEVHFTVKLTVEQNNKSPRKHRHRQLK